MSTIARATGMNDVKELTDSLLHRPIIKRSSSFAQTT